MKRLTILYDPVCAFCRNCVRWLRTQPKYLDLEFIAAGSPEARRRYPTLDPAGTVANLTVVDDELNVYYGSKAYIICLYALRKYRELSWKLSGPNLWPYARKAFGIVTENRRNISRLIASLRSNERREKDKVPGNY